MKEKREENRASRRTGNISRRFPALALPVSLLISAIAQAQAPAFPATEKAAPAPAASKLKLTLLAENGLKLNPDESGLIDCGVVDPLTTPRIERAFTLRNATGLPMTLTRLKTSCGCESVAFLRDGKEQPSPDKQPALLAPGEQAQIRVAVSLTGRQAYIKHASLWVYAKESPTPVASVEIVAQIEPAILFDPPVLQFNKSTAGSAPVIAFSVAFDPRLTGPGKTWRAVSSNPAVTVTAQPGEKQEQRGAKSVVVRSYRAALSANAPTGPLSGAITFTLQDAAAAPSAAANPSVSISFSAERSGTFAMSPPTLLFGSVTAGKEYRRQILVSAASTALLQSAKFTSDNRAVTVRAGMPEATAGGAALRLEVIISDQAPAGGLTAHITIQSASGERLVLPVIAQIDSGPKR